jgi:hypothetical protein
MHNQFNAELDCKPVKLGSGALPRAPFRIAHLTGTGQMPEDAMALAEMKKFMDAGGTLIIDAAGGSSEFATSIEHVLGQLFPAIKPERLSLDDPVYVPQGTQALKQTAFRPFARTRLGTSDAGPRVQAYRVNGRIACLYSREDLSAGMVGEPVDGILGYTPASATQIMARLILSSAAKP